jgi:hypothetical protein
MEMMGEWPEYESDRLSSQLLRVDLQEKRCLSLGAWQQLIDHLIRSAAVACLVNQEDLAQTLLCRTAQRMSEWVEQVRQGLPVSLYNQDFAPVRGMLSLALVGEEAGPVPENIAAEFLRQTSRLPAGPVHNARLAAAILCNRLEEAQNSLSLCSLEDAALGAPWKRFIQGLIAKDAAIMQNGLERWLEEKMEATQTHDWGAYNEVPLEVTGALALSERAGFPLKLHSNRILPRYRA